MTQRKKIRTLVNVPPGFYETPQLRPAFRRLGKIATVRRRSHDTAEQIRKDLAWAEAVIMWSWPVLTDDLLAQAPNLRFAGHINIGAEGARAELGRRLAVSEARHGWSPAVAEMALTLALAGLRKTSAYHCAMRSGKEKWIGRIPADIDPMERQLSGRSVGIVGLGAIGKRLSELLAPFQVDLRTYDPYVASNVGKQYRAKKTSLMELLRASDVVVLCAANTENARHLLGPREIAAFRKGCVLVNVGRAMLVDMDALIARLRKGDMVAMLDVFRKEPLPKSSPLRKLPNACLTPHRAGGLIESCERIFDMLIGDLELYLEGKPRRYAMTRDMLNCV